MEITFYYRVKTNFQISLYGKFGAVSQLPTRNFVKTNRFHLQKLTFKNNAFKHWPWKVFPLPRPPSQRDGPKSGFCNTCWGSSIIQSMSSKTICIWPCCKDKRTEEFQHNLFWWQGTLAEEHQLTESVFRLMKQQCAYTDICWLFLKNKIYRVNWCLPIW